MMIVSIGSTYKRFIKSIETIIIVAINVSPIED